MANEQCEYRRFPFKHLNQTGHTKAIDGLISYEGKHLEMSNNNLNKQYQSILKTRIKYRFKRITTHCFR